MPRDVVVLFARPEGRKLIERHCRKSRIKVADLRSLVDLEIDQVGRDRKRDLWPAFDEVLGTSLPISFILMPKVAELAGGTGAA